jgi:hypothetical protein
VLAVLFIVANMGLGLYVLNGNWFGLIPIIGSSAATWAVFTMEGVAMRCVLLSATACWLANNIHSGSIGGTVLETFVAIANATTILRMTLEARRQKADDADAAR